MRLLGQGSSANPAHVWGEAARHGLSRTLKMAGDYWRVTSCDQQSLLIKFRWSNQNKESGVGEEGGWGLPSTTLIDAPSWRPWTSFSFVRPSSILPPNWREKEVRWQASSCSIRTRCSSATSSWPDTYRQKQKNPIKQTNILDTGYNSVQVI